MLKDPRKNGVYEMSWGYFCIITLSLFLRALYANQDSSQAITYEFGGRFGDNLLAYFHAKWVSYKYDIPLFYKEFTYSSGLRMHNCENYTPQQEMETIAVSNIQDIERALERPVLIVLPYFPESKWERDHAPEQGFQWAYIPVDWEDKEFKKILQSNTEPIVNLEKIQIPDNLISVACHLRRGGGYDPECTFQQAALKFPQDNFYIAEIQWLLKLFRGQQLYVHLFTDDPNPIQIKRRYERIFRHQPVFFGCRSVMNYHNLHVLDDFFAMTQFDCSIHGESNFSICAAKISDYLVECQPTDFHWENQTLIIDRVLRRVRKSKIEQHAYIIDTNQLQGAHVLE